MNQITAIDPDNNIPLLFTKLTENNILTLFGFLSFNESISFLTLNKSTNRFLLSHPLFKHYLSLKKEFKSPNINLPKYREFLLDKNKPKQLQVSKFSNSISNKEFIINWNKYSLENLLNKNMELIAKINKKYSIPKQISLILFSQIIAKQILTSIQNLHLQLTNLDIKNNYEYLISSINHLSSIKFRSVSITQSIVFNGIYLNSLMYHNSRMKIQILNLNNNKIDNKCCGTLFLNLYNNFPHLTSIDLSYNCLSNKCFILKTIKNYFSNQKIKLQQLNLSHNELGYKGAVELFNILSNNKTLSLLNLSFNGIDSGLFINQTTISFFENSKSLSSFIYEGNYIDTKEIKYVVQCLLSNFSVKYLNLSNNQLENKSFEQIGNLISNNFCICSLNLSYNNLSKGINNLFKNISSCSNLYEINISNSSLNSESLQIIANKLINNYSICHLDISNNTFTKIDCGNYLFNLISNNYSIRNLNLNGCKLGGDNIALVLKGMGNNKIISVLNIGSNNLSNNSKAYTEFQNMMNKNKTLKYLFMDLNTITDKEFEVICEGIKMNTVLRLLSLKWNRIMLKNCTDNVFDNIQFNDTIKVIELDGNPLGNEKALETLKIVLDNNGKKFVK